MTVFLILTVCTKQLLIVFSIKTSMVMVSVVTVNTKQLHCAVFVFRLFELLYDYNYLT